MDAAAKGKFKWDSMVYLDLRGAGMLRLVLGLILVVKFWGTVPRNFDQVFGGDGLLGSCYAENYLRVYGGGSPLFHVQSDAFLISFAVMAGLVMLFFTVGAYPRVMAAVGSVLLWLWNDRFGMLWFGWEQYAQVLLFLCIFLPTGKAFGIASQDADDGRRDYRIGGPLVFAMLFQIAIIYFYNGISKNGDRWMDGTAVQFSLAGMSRQLMAGEWLVQQDMLCKAATWLTLAWEILLPVLIFAPLRNQVLRTLAAISIPAFHWSLSIFMDVGDFKFISIGVGFLLIPSIVWDKLPWMKAEIMALRFKLPGRVPSLPSWASMATGVVLVWVILGSNLKMSLQSRTDDRMKAWLGGGIFQEFVEVMVPDGLPRHSFFAQHWHLFSPNPPPENGYIQSEITYPDGRTAAVFAGEEGMVQLPTKTLRFLYQYLAMSRNNKFSEVLASCMATREANLWHDKHPGQQAKSLTLALYSWTPEDLATLKAGPEKGIKRVELIRLGFDY